MLVVGSPHSSGEKEEVDDLGRMTAKYQRAPLSL